MLLLYPYAELGYRMGLYEFTFHYASTLSSPRYQFPFSPIVFTFHYASTLSYFAVAVTWYYIDLHSTMLLLYLTPPTL